MTAQYRKYQIEITSTPENEPGHVRGLVFRTDDAPMEFHSYVGETGGLNTRFTPVSPLWEPLKHAEQLEMARALRRAGVFEMLEAEKRNE